MRCPRCNRESKDGTVFCPACGAPLSLRPEPTAPALDATLDLDRRAVGEVRPAPPREPRAQPPTPARPAIAVPRAAPPAAVPRPAQPAAAPRPVAHPASSPAAPLPVGRPAPPAAPAPRPQAHAAPPLPEAEPRPASPPPLRAAERPLPGPEPSRWELPLSQMPRERRPDLDPERAPAERRTILAPEAQPEVSGSLEVAIGRVEVHVRRAPNWKRSLAWLLDGIPFAALFAFALRVALDRLPHAAPLDLSAAIELAGTELSGITGPLFAGTLVLFAAYHVLAHGMSGATLGKKLVGIRVVGPDGKRPGLGRAAVRAVLGAMSLVLLGMGVLLALFTRSGRALHDLLSRTWVVEASP